MSGYDTGMEKVTVYLDHAAAMRLRSLAVVRGCTTAELVSEAISEFLHQELATRPEPVGVGQFRSGRNDISGRAKELLRNAARGHDVAD